MMDAFSSKSRTHCFLAPAKVNLALRIVGRRADGFHLLWTVMTFFPLYDTVAVTCPATDLRLTCDPPVTDDPEENLVFRVAQRLREETGTRQGAWLHLTKRIPHGAGLGGGSSDAATTLLALNKLWKLNLPLPRLLSMAVSLGADIPIFLGQRAALVEGIGERLTPLPHLATAELVVVNPGVVLATGRVFQAYGRQKNQSDATSAPCVLPACVLPEDYVETVMPLLTNDLQSAAVQMVPVIDKVARELRKLGAQATLMSGSGASLFGVFSDSRQADVVVKTLTQAYPAWQIFTGRTFNIHPFANAWKSGIR